MRLSTLMSFIPKDIEKPYKCKVIAGPFKGTRGVATCQYIDGVIGILGENDERAFAKEDQIICTPNWKKDWARESIFDAVEQFSALLSDNAFADAFQSHLPGEETVIDHPELENFEAAREWAVNSGFADNLADSLDEGIEMLTSMLAHAVEMLEEWENLACTPCRTAVNPDSVT
tara:strand:+ start:2381 stop:2902 length:522 start_codon:yes stop_codon:yes gene_type:complete